MINLPLPETATVPDWIELLPPGPAIIGADGRQWLNDTPDRVVAAFMASNQPMVCDYEHSSEHRAPMGLDAPAAGWIDRLEIRTGAIWGHVEWTAQARQRIEAREYRFVSPVFTYHKADSRIAALQSVALTNQPNLKLTALNSQHGDLLTARCRQEFATNTALRAEFGDVETLIAYHRAVANNFTVKEKTNEC
jgi:phage I-like protein